MKIETEPENTKAEAAMNVLKFILKLALGVLLALLVFMGPFWLYRQLIEDDNVAILASLPLYVLIVRLMPEAK
jgi:hypothetical protein